MSSRQNDGLCWLSYMKDPTPHPRNVQFMTAPQNSRCWWCQNCIKESSTHLGKNTRRCLWKSKEYKSHKKIGFISKWPACTKKRCCRSDVIYMCTQFCTVKFAVSAGLWGGWQAILSQPSSKPLPYVHFHHVWWKSEQESERFKWTEYKQKRYVYLGQCELLNRLICSTGNLYSHQFVLLMTYIKELSHLQRSPQFLALPWETDLREINEIRPESREKKSSTKAKPSHTSVSE